MTYMEPFPALQLVEDMLTTAIQRSKHSGGGGGGGGGGRRDRGQHRGYDSPSYGQPSQPPNISSSAQNVPPAGQAPSAGAAGGADPYAACK